MASLTRLKDELFRLDWKEALSASSAGADGLLSVASQTDLSGELLPVGARLAHLAQMRLQYEGARRDMQVRNWLFLLRFTAS